MENGLDIELISFLSDSETQERGLWGVKIQKHSLGTMPQDLPRSRKSVLILDPRLISIHFAIESFLFGYVLFYSKPAQSVCLLARTI